MDIIELLKEEMKAINTKEGHIFLPDGDTHFASYGHRLCDYQRKVYVAALKCMEGKYAFRAQAIDIGAHVGLFSRRMEKDFDEVIAFEPEPHNFDCLNSNTGDKVINCRTALGNASGKGELRNPEPVNSGAWELTKVIGANVRMLLDDIHVMKLDDIHVIDLHPSFIKIDAQGSELSILEGAVETLKEWHPVMIVEVTLHNTEASGIYDFMKGLGYELGPRHNKDQIFW